MKLNLFLCLQSKAFLEAGLAFYSKLMFKF